MIRTVPETLRAMAARQPDATAMVFEGRDTSYGALDAMADRVALVLAGAGLKPGDRLLYLGKNGDQFFPLLYGAMRAGVVVTPINWRLSPQEAATIVRDSGATMLVLGPDAPEDVAAHLADAFRALAILRYDAAAASPFDAWLAPTAILPVIGPDDIALQLYTSGTTGLPKGVMLAHRGFVEPLARRRAAGIEWEQLGPGDSVIVDLPVYHLGGTSWPMMALQCGATLRISREFSASFILAALAGGARIPALLMVPATMQILLSAAQGVAERFECLSFIRYGGSPISEDLLRRCVERFDCRFVQTYGSTETGGFVSALGPEEHVLPPTPQMRTAGRAVEHVELAIADADGSHLPAGEAGEIIVRSTANMAGYWARPDAMASAWFPGGWLRTGDAGRIDEAGYLTILDRMRDMIITGGENVYPAEVENALAAHPAVADVAVIGVADERWGEAICAFVVLRPGGEMTGEELRAFCMERIARYKCPQHVRFLAELPRNASGKVLRRLLREDA